MPAGCFLALWKYWLALLRLSTFAGQPNFDDLSPANGLSHPRICMMHHLVYSSTANSGLTETELQRHLERWRATNAGLHITGLLLFSAEGNIMQVLEGDATLVHQLYAAIAADIRHRNVVKLADGPVPDRAFANWSMHFRSVDTTDFARLVPRPDATPAHIRNLVPLLEAFLAEEPLN